MFSAAQQEECLDIPIDDDSDFEGTESFFFSIAPSQNDRAVMVGTPSIASVDILDNEDGV